jgi:hypothetical protein
MFSDPGKTPSAVATPVIPPLAAATTTTTNANTTNTTAAAVATSHGMAVDHIWLVTTVKWVTQKSLLLYMEGCRDPIVDKIYQVHTWQSLDCLRGSQTIISTYIYCNELAVMCEYKGFIKIKSHFLTLLNFQTFRYCSNNFFNHYVTDRVHRTPDVSETSGVAVITLHLARCI